MSPRLLLLLALFLPAATATQPDPRYFHYQRPLHLPAAAHGQTCASLDAPIFTHSAAGLADLRLYQGQREVPYVIHQSIRIQPSSQQQPALLNLGEQAGHAVFDARIFDSSYSTIQIETAAKDFVANFEVSGSQAIGGHPSTRLGTYTIFDLTSQKLDRSTVLHLPASTFPYLHFSVSRPLKAADITGVTIAEIPSEDAVYRLVAQSKRSALDGHNSVFTFDVPAHVPVDQIVFRPGPQPVNFRRTVAIDARPQPLHRDNAGRSESEGEDPEVQPYSARSTAVLSRVHMIQHGQHIDEENLSFPAAGPAVASTVATAGQDDPVRWTITVENGDDAPLPIDFVQLQMHERQLCFDAAANPENAAAGESTAAYTVSYGDPVLHAPQYDYASLFQPESNPAQATFGDEQPNPQYQPRPDTRAFTEKHPAVLWIALALAVTILAAIAFRTASRMMPKSS